LTIYPKKGYNKRMMWNVEDKKAAKEISKLPLHIQENYKYWKRIIIVNGIEKIREIKSYHFEKLSGKRQGQHSCRLSKGYRIIFEIQKNIITVFVLEVNKHDY
jgi:mRNA-degrading endonuclease RelE of RelBE toxin-antitoxin system